MTSPAREETHQQIRFPGCGVTGTISVMRRQPFLLVPALATLTCAILADCTAGGTSRAARHTTAPSPRPAASSPQATGRIGSPGNPLLLSCAQEAFPGYPGPPVPSHPRPEDLAIGSLYLANGRIAADADPGPIWIRTLWAQRQVLQTRASRDDGLYGHHDDRPTGPRPRGDRQSVGPESRSRRSDLHYLPFLPPQARLLRPRLRLHSSPGPRLRAPRCDDRQSAPRPPRHPVAVRRIVPTLTFVALAALPIEYETINQAAHNA